MKKTLDIKKLVLLNMPYILLGLFATNFGEAWRMAQGADASEKFLSLVAVRVLLGSTAKMGAGTNVQDRLVALHDLDCPWRPGDLAQRKPFLYEEELRSKNARLVELDTLLNIDGKGQAHAEAVVAKSTRTSVLDSLKRPVQPRSTDKKPKQHEEVR